MRLKILSIGYDNYHRQIVFGITDVSITKRCIGWKRLFGIGAPCRKVCGHCLRYDDVFEHCTYDGIPRSPGCKACPCFESWKKHNKKNPFSVIGKALTKLLTIKNKSL